MMIRNQKTSSNILQQFNQFKSQLESTGKSPEVILNDLINSGKITKEQLDKATSLAKMYSWLGGK